MRTRIETHGKWHKTKTPLQNLFFFLPPNNEYFMEHLRFQLEINLSPDFNSFPKLFMTLREAESKQHGLRGSNYDRKTKANTETNEILKEAGN